MLYNIEPGQPFMLFERMRSYGPFGTLGGGLELGNPGYADLEGHIRIIASSHDGYTIMFWNGNSPQSEFQWANQVGTSAGEPVWGPSGASETLEAILNNLLFFWEDAADINEKETH